MAKINFVQGKFESFLDSGDVNNGGDVALFSPDGTYSTPKTTYTTFSLTTPNAHPKVLDSAGRATLYFEGDADVRVRDSAAATVYTQRNVNPVTTIVVTNVTTPTAISSTTNDQYITTTADLTLPTASAAGAGWFVTIKNLDTVIHTISRGTSGDSINSVVGEFNLPPRESIRLVVNSGVTGFDIYFNPLLEISGVAGQALVIGASGPAWTTVDLVNPGSDLYMFNNFT